MLRLIFAFTTLFAQFSNAQAICEVYLSKQGLSFERDMRFPRETFADLVPHYVANRAATDFSSATGRLERVTPNDLMLKGFITKSGDPYFFVQDVDGTMLVNATTHEKTKISSRTTIDMFDYFRTKSGHDLVAFKSYHDFLTVYDLTEKREIYSKKPEDIYRAAAGPQWAWPIGHYSNNPMESFRLFEDENGVQLATNWVWSFYELARRSNLTGIINLQSGEVNTVAAQDMVDHFVFRDGTEVKVFRQPSSGDTLNLNFRMKDSETKREVEVPFSDLYFGDVKKIDISQIGNDQAIFAIEYEYFVRETEFFDTAEHQRRLAFAKEYFNRNFAHFGQEMADRQYALFEEDYLSGDGTRKEKNSRRIRKYFLLDKKSSEAKLIGRSNTLRKSLGTYDSGDGRLFSLDLDAGQRLLLTTVSNSKLTSTIVGPNTYNQYVPLKSLVLANLDKQVAVLLQNAEYDGSYFELRH